MRDGLIMSYIWKFTAIMRLLLPRLLHNHDLKLIEIVHVERKTLPWARKRIIISCNFVIHMFAPSFLVHACR